MRRAVQALAGTSGGLPHEVSMGRPARATVAAGILMGLTLLVWRIATAAGRAVVPGSNPFDAFLILSLLLSLAVVYLRWTRHLRSLAFFLLPMIVILVFLGLILSTIHAKSQEAAANFNPLWLRIHLVTIVATSACFALACVGGVVYLMADRQLRRKGLPESHRWIGLPPLASIEKFNRWMVYTGFPLLTFANVAGILHIRSQPDPELSPKMAVGILAWIVYAVLLHVPLNPRFRGRRAAWLAIVGFTLCVVAFAAARWGS
jgi:ABC-type uncharacterized transport system permease subunit